MTMEDPLSLPRRREPWNQDAKQRHGNDRGGEPSRPPDTHGKWPRRCWGIGSSMCPLLSARVPDLLWGNAL
jgi:hypothetical protein